MSRPGVSKEEEAPPAYPHSSHRMKEEERWLELPTCIRNGGGAGVAVAGASHLLVPGRRSCAARGRSEPLIAVSSLPLHAL
jgi:hypothetical protein